MDGGAGMGLLSGLGRVAGVLDGPDERSDVGVAHDTRPFGLAVGCRIGHATHLPKGVRHGLLAVFTAHALYGDG